MKAHLTAPLLLIALFLSSPTAAWGLVEVIVDDQHGPPGFTTTGDDWATWATLGLGYDANDTSFHYLSSTVGGGDRRGTATWTPVLPCAGTYSVAVWFRMTGNRTVDADHFIYDGHGDSAHVVIDQNGERASGWMSLGDYYCNAGPGGCTVTLDGTDDDGSDAANAARFVLDECEGDPDDSVEVCGEAYEPGVYTLTRSATRAWTSGDWRSPGLAAGEADGQGAESPNLDAGEIIYGGGWGFCKPAERYRITSVELESRGKTQYDSGSYDVIVRLSGGGQAHTDWHHTGWAWDHVDLTGDKASWSWFDINHLDAKNELGSHPGGSRDSDVWVDAFKLSVSFEVIEEEAPPDSGVLIQDALVPEQDAVVTVFERDAEVIKQDVMTEQDAQPVIDLSLLSDVYHEIRDMQPGSVDHRIDSSINEEIDSEITTAENQDSQNTGTMNGGCSSLNHRPHPIPIILMFGLLLYCISRFRLTRL